MSEVDEDRIRLEKSGMFFSTTTPSSPLDVRKNEKKSERTLPEGFAWDEKYGLVLIERG